MARRIWVKADSGDLTLGSPGTFDSVSGDDVISWTDQTGNGFHGAAPTADDRPLLVEDVHNGKPALFFGPRVGGLDGGTRLVFPDDCVSGLTAGEGFIVLKLRDDPPSAEYYSALWEWGGGAIGGDQNNHYRHPGTEQIVDTFGANTQITTAIPANDLSEAHVYNVMSKAGEWTSRMNGQQLFTTSGHTVSFPGTAIPNSLAQLGTSRPDEFGMYWGYIFEFSFFDFPLTCEERYDEVSRLRDHWGIEGVVPEDCEGVQRGGVTRFTHLIRGGTMRTSVGMGGQPKGRYKAWKPLTVRKPYPTLPINIPAEPTVGGGLTTRSLTESVTIAAAGFTDTTIQLPVGAIASVSVLVTTAIPGPTTHFSVGDAADVNRFQVANVPVALGSSDPGTRSVGYFNATATAVRLSMVGGSPATNAGRVRVTINYYA